jgi:hypothetical protein
MGATRLPSCKEVDAEWSACSSEEEDINDDNACSLDQSSSMTSSSMFKRQMSAPVQFARQVSAPANRMPSCEEVLSDEPEIEPEEDDSDLFEPMSAPNRQISNFSTKTPSRQVSAMSNWSAQDWEPIGHSGIQRQETDEKWPSWNGSLGKDALESADSEPLAPVSQDNGSTGAPLFMTFTPMNLTTENVDMQSMAAMLQNCGAMYTYQLPQDNAGHNPYPRKRESLIDLAKQEQEQKAAIRADASKSSSIKFCPWCGGRFQPSFKFCVFCGNSFSGVVPNCP